jgi:hypothetical protein
MKNLINKYKVFWPEILLFLGIFLIFKINSHYLAYPDEFVNLLGGMAINKGGVPYKDFFDHHLPLAWYLAAILLRISFNSFTLFRFFWMLFNFFTLLFVGLWIRKNHKSFYNYYLGFFLLYPLMGIYFWFHLYLADSLAVLFFASIFWLLLVQTLTKKIDWRILLLTSFLNFCLAFSSMTFLYLVLVLYLWQLYLVFISKKNWLSFIGVSLIPYLMYFIYLLVTGSFSDFYFSNFVYNTKLYIAIPNYVKGRFFNPLKFALTLIYNFYDNYLPLLTKIKHLDLYLPIGVLAGLGSLTLLVLLLTKDFFAGAIFFFLLSFSAPRSNIQNYRETDYQASLFLVLGTIAAFISCYLLRKLKTEDLLFQDLQRIVQLLLFIFMFFTFLFLGQNSYGKFFQIYTQKMPGIYNYSYNAQFIDQILDESDFYWYGPYEPQEEFFVKKAKLPGKYPTLLPQFREDEYLKNSFIAQFEKNKPAIIIFRHEASIFMTPAMEFGKFFIDWMSNKYTSIENIKGVKIIKSPSGFNIRTDLYLLNTRKNELLEKLKEQGFIE